jgi:hypothetical protein
MCSLLALPTIGWAFLGFYTTLINGQMVRVDFYQQTAGAGAPAVLDSAMRVFGHPRLGAQRREEFESIVKDRLRQAAGENSSSREELYRLIADSWSAFPPALGSAVPASFDEVYTLAIINNQHMHMRTLNSYTMVTSTCTAECVQ